MKCIICDKILTEKQSTCCSRKCVGIYSNQNRKRKKTRITNGYKEIHLPEWGSKNNYVREHILVMSGYIGRKVKYPENIHHIDGNKLNNKIKNLYLFTNVKPHSELHKQMERLVFQMYKDGLVEFVDGEYKLKEAVARLWLKLNTKIEYGITHINGKIISPNLKNEDGIKGTLYLVPAINAED